MEAATYLPSLGHVTVKPPVDSDLSTLLRIVPFRHSVWKCREYILPLLFFSHEFAQRRLSRPPLPPPPYITPCTTSFSIYSSTTRVWLFIRSSIRPPICSSADTLSIRRIRSRISVRRDARIVLLFSFGNLLAGSLVFTHPLFFSLPRADWHSSLKVQILLHGFAARTRHYDITFLHVNKF